MNIKIGAFVRWLLGVVRLILWDLLGRRKDLFLQLDLLNRWDRWDLLGQYLLLLRRGRFLLLDQMDHWDL